jgi:transposase
VHGNARLNRHGRRTLIQRIQRGRPVDHVAAELAISRATAYKWWGRFRREGRDGLEDRSSRPRSCPHRTPRRVERRSREGHVEGMRGLRAEGDTVAEREAQATFAVEDEITAKKITDSVASVGPTAIGSSNQLDHLRHRRCAGASISPIGSPQCLGGTNGRQRVPSERATASQPLAALRRVR